MTNATARPGLDHLEGLGVAVRRDDVHAEVLRSVDLGDLLMLVVPAVDTNGLALQVGERADVRGLLRDPSGWR